LPALIMIWVAVMLLSLRYGWLDGFFWGAQHAHVQGIDYFALPKSFLNLLEHRSMYDSWHGVPFGPYATWYLAHPVFSVLVMPWFAFMPAWVSYAMFVLFSLSIMAYCGFLFSKQASNSKNKIVYYALFLLAFPVYWMLYVGNMHALFVLSLTLILLAIYEMAYTKMDVKRSEQKLLMGLLLSFFTKPLVILFIPILLCAKETRRTMLRAGIIYAAVSILVLSLPWLNPESIGWSKRLAMMFNMDAIKNSMNIYQNHFVLNEYMKDNGIHWFNLIAQSGYRFNHIDNFSFPVFLDALFDKHFPDMLYVLPLLAAPLCSIMLLFIQDKLARLQLLLLLVAMSSISFFLSYNTVWEYQYTSALPVVALLYCLKDKQVFSEKQMIRLFVASSFFYLPSLYCLLDSSNFDRMFILIIHVTREISTLALFLVLGSRVVQSMAPLLRVPHHCLRALARAMASKI